MRIGKLPSGEFIPAYWRKYDPKLEETVKEGVLFYGKQLGGTFSNPFQAEKGAVEKISNPLETLDSTTIMFDFYTTSRLPFKSFDEIDLGGNTYTIDEVVTLKDSSYAISNFRTGKYLFPRSLKLK